MPVPTIVPAQATGNIPLGIASVALFAKRAGAKTRPVLLGQDIANQWGDRAIIDLLLHHQPSVIGFSCSVWNVERTLFIAGQIRKSAPKIQIWLGGPEITADSPFVSNPTSPFDIAVSGEGEAAVAHLLCGVSPHSMEGLLLPGGTRTKGAIRPSALGDLSGIHDPFMEGLVQTEADGVLYAELRRGCRYGCSFCRYHQGRKGLYSERSLSQISELFRYARRKRISEVYVLDPSFEQHNDFADFLRALARINRNPAIPLFVELRAEAISKPIAALLFASGVRKIETGLQSVSTAALARAGRKLEMENFIRGVDALRANGIAVKTDIMVGLPNDSYDGFAQTVEFVKKHGLDEDLQIFQTQVLPGTTLRRQAARQGISYQQRPPYHITAAPGWRAEDLRAAMEYAQDKLEISLAPEMRPVLGGHGMPAQNVQSHSAGSQRQFAFDLERAVGIEALKRETFENAAAHVLIQLRAKDPNPFRSLIGAAVDRLSADNPFSSLSIVLESEPNVPLDIADSLDMALDRNLHSSYLENLHSPCTGRRPQRRIFFLLRDQETQAAGEWLIDARQIAEIIWASSPSRIASIFSSRKFDAHRDYVFIELDLGKYEDPSKLFSRLARTPFPSRILLTGPDLHGNWIDFLERNQLRPKQNVA